MRVPPLARVRSVKNYPKCKQKLKQNFKRPKKDIDSHDGRFASYNIGSRCFQAEIIVRGDAMVTNLNVRDVAIYGDTTDCAGVCHGDTPDCAGVAMVTLLIMRGVAMVTNLIVL